MSIAGNANDRKEGESGLTNDTLTSIYITSSRFQNDMDHVGRQNGEILNGQSEPWNSRIDYTPDDADPNQRESPQSITSRPIREPHEMINVYVDHRWRTGIKGENT